MVNIFNLIELVSLVQMVIASSFTHQDNILNGRHLVITTSAFSPYVLIDHDANGKLTQVHGFVNELVVWLSAKYNFTYHYIEPPDGFYGAFINNTWNGMVRLIIDQEADMIAFPLTPTYARTLVIDFAIPFAEDPMVALIPPPNPDGKINAIVKPYQAQVWALIIASMLSIALTTWLAAKLTNMYSKEYNPTASELKLAHHILVAFGVISCQGQYLPHNGAHSTRIAAATWCLTAIIFVYLYSGCLISFLTLPKLRPIVESLDQLADQTDLQVSTLKTHFFESLLLDAKSGTYKKLGDKIRNNPQNSLSNRFVKLDNMAEKSEKAFFLDVIEHYLKKTGKCGMSIMKEEFYQTREAFAIPKGRRSQIRLLDQGINIMRDTGYIEYWHKQLNKINKCTAPPTNKRRKVPRLTMSDLAGSFVFWGCGLAFSLLLFLFERLVFFTLNRTSIKKAY